MQHWVRSSVYAVYSWKTVTQKDSIETQHQNRNLSVLKAGLTLSLSLWYYYYYYYSVVSHVLIYLLGY